MIDLCTGAAGSFAQTTPAHTLTRDELRLCMNREDELRQRSEKVQAEAMRANEEAAAIAAESAQLIRASANGFKDKAARDAHVARSAALDRRVSAYNARSRQIRLSTADSQAAQAEYLRSCGGKSYYVEDRNAVLAERESAGSAPKAAEPGASAPGAR